MFSKLFSEKGCFSRISEGTLGTGVVLELVRPSEPWCFPAGSCFYVFFEVVFLRAGAGNRNSRKMLFF